MAVRHGQLASSTAANANWTFTTLVSTKSAQLRPVFLISVVSLLFERPLSQSNDSPDGKKQQQQLWNRNAVSDFHECTQKHSRFPSFSSFLLPLCALYLSLSSFRLNTHTANYRGRPYPSLHTHTLSCHFDGKRTRWTSCWWKVCVYVHCTRADYF